jgi:metal transporter CNNM
MVAPDSTVPRLQAHPVRAGDDVIDNDLVLRWTEPRRIITGSDVPGPLLPGIVQSESVRFERLAT